MAEENESAEWMAETSLIRDGKKSFVRRHPHLWWNARKSDLAAIAGMPEADEGFHVLFLRDSIQEKDFEN